MVPLGGLPLSLALLVASEVPVVAADDGANAAYVFTLDELLVLAETHAPALQASAARQQAGAKLVDAAGAWFPDNPGLSISAGPRLASTVGLDVSVSLSQALEVAGEPGLRVEAASRERDVLNAELAAARWQVHVDVHADFLRAVVLKDRVATEGDGEREANEILAALQKRAAAGDASPLEVDIALADAVAARLAHARAEQELRAQLASVAADAGVAGDIEVSGSVVAASAGPVDVDAAVARQPALAVRGREAERAAARLQLAEREGWPKPFIGVTYTAENLGQESEHIVLGTIGLPLPFWQVNQRERAEAAVDVAGADAELAAARLLTTRRLQTARVSAESAAKLLRSSREETLPVVERSVGLLRRAFELGEIDAVELSNARQRLIAARRELLDAEVAWVDAFADLEVAAGFDPSPSSTSSSDGGSP